MTYGKARITLKTFSSIRGTLLRRSWYFCASSGDGQRPQIEEVREIRKLLFTYYIMDRVPPILNRAFKPITSYVVKNENP